MRTSSFAPFVLEIIVMVMGQINIPIYQSSVNLPSLFNPRRENDSRDPIYLPLETCRPAVVDIHTILPRAEIDWESLTISGFSSGAIMTIQFTVAHSSEVKGAGIFSGFTYGQYYKNAFPGGFRFMTGNFPYTPVPLLAAVLNPVFPYPTVEELTAQAVEFAATGKIDDLSNLKDKRIFVYHGKMDPVINNTHGYRLSEFFRHFGADVVTDLNHDANHVLGTSYFPTNLTTLCSKQPGIITAGIENCGYDLVFDTFRHLYGDDYVAPVSANAAHSGSFYAFDQTTLTASGDNVADYMDYVGYLYVPKKCKIQGNTCKIHIALHGCLCNVYNE